MSIVLKCCWLKESESIRQNQKELKQLSLCHGFLLGGSHSNTKQHHNTQQHHKLYTTNTHLPDVHPGLRQPSVPAVNVRQVEHQLVWSLGQMSNTIEHNKQQLLFISSFETALKTVVAMTWFGQDEVQDWWMLMNERQCSAHQLKLYLLTPAM